MASRIPAVHFPSTGPRVGIRRLRCRNLPVASASASASASTGGSSAPKARFAAERSVAVSVHQLQRPLEEYMALPVSQYSVLDAQRIERVDENTFRCFIYKLKFFGFEVCPVLLVRVEQEPLGCCIRLLSCKLEGSPLVEAQNDKFSASMVNRVSCSSDVNNSGLQKLTTNTTIEVISDYNYFLQFAGSGISILICFYILCYAQVIIDIPSAFRIIPVQAIESAGTQVLEQLLRIVLPRFTQQLVKDYKAWASGNTSRQPLGTGEI